jgi:radical SAM protein with 4Fe4S-binding SPASM domain
LRKLIEVWVKEMKDEGRVLKLYPFIGVMESMLLKEASLLRCGAGWSLFNIQTDGNITPCPVMAGLKGFYLGNVSQTSPNNLQKITAFSEPCSQCDINTLCGGRCLYANATKLWGNRGFDQVCSTVRNMITVLQERLPEVEQLIRAGRISLNDFQYTKYNGCEIIP